MDESFNSRARPPQGNSFVQLPGGFLVAFLICLILISAKWPDALLDPQFWAEDGAIFYAQQFGHKWPLLFTPYAGYLHFVPRLIAWLASGVEPAHMPLVYNLSAIIIQALCIAYAVKRMSPLFGGVVALLAFFLTPTIGDIFGTMTNIQWITQFALIFGVLGSALDRPYWLGDGVAAGLILVASLTGPFSVLQAFFIILLGSLVLAARGRAHLQRFADALGHIVAHIEPTRLAALFLGAAAQFVTMATNTARTPEEFYRLTSNERESFGLTNIENQSSYLHAIWGFRGGNQLLLDGVYGVIFLLVVVAALRRTSVGTMLRAVLLAIGAVQPVIAFLKQHEGHTLSSVSHYYYFLGVIAFCCAATMLTSVPTKYRSELIASAAGCLALFFLRYPDYLIRPRLINTNWPAFAAKISAGERNVVAPLNPGWRAVFNAD